MATLSNHYLFVCYSYRALTERLNEKTSIVWLANTHKRPKTAKKDFSVGSLSVSLLFDIVSVNRNFQLSEHPLVPTSSDSWHYTQATRLVLYTLDYQQLKKINPCCKVMYIPLLFFCRLQSSQSERTRSPKRFPTKAGCVIPSSPPLWEASFHLAVSSFNCSSSWTAYGMLKLPLFSPYINARSLILSGERKCEEAKVLMYKKKKIPPKPHPLRRPKVCKYM